MSNINKVKPRATHEGVLELGDIKIPVAVLQDGTRLITQSGFLLSIGRSRTPKSGTGAKVADLPTFLAAGNLKPFITNELLESTTPVNYITAGGRDAWGYKAVLLPQVCEVYLNANDANALLTSQKQILARCQILVRGLARIGIIALVDEATGYQYDRERDELQRILRAYITEELLPWQKKFPDVFYREIFRLNGWSYTVADIKKRPSVIGKWTNKFIYEQLPKGVLNELKQKTPKSNAGNYTARFHQSLTEDIGNPHLQAQINSVIPLMQISDNWQQFVSHFNKMVDRRSGQTEIKFEDVEYKGEPKKVEGTGFNKLLGAVAKVPKPEK